MKRLILAISLLTSSLFAQATGDLIIQKVTLTGATEVYLTPTATRLLGLDSSGNPTTVSLVDSLTMPGNELTIGPADSWLLTLPIPDSDTISTEQAGMGWADDRVTIQTPVGALQFYETGDPAESVIYWPGRLQIDTIEANEVTTTFDADQIVSGTFSTLIFQNSNVPPMRQWQDRAADAGAHGLTYGNTGPAGVNEATTPGRYYPIIDVVDDNSTGNYLSGEILEADDLLNGVLPAQSGNSGKYLTTNGTVASWGTVTAGVALGDSPTWTGAHIFSKNGALSSPTITLTGTPVTGGSATTTKPLFLLEPSGTTSTGWNTAGTLLGINAPTGFTGDLQWWGENGTRYGRWFEFAGVYPSFGISAPGGGNEIFWYNAYGSLTLHAAASFNISSTQSAGQSVITCSNSNGVTAYWHLATTGAASQIQLGVSSSSPTDYVLFGTAATGTNIAGGDLTLSGGRNTGNAAGGAIILATAPAGSSGSTPGSPIARLTIDTDGHIIAASLPTSATGLPSGTLWNDSGTLKISP